MGRRKSGKKLCGKKLCVVNSCSTDNGDIYKIFIVDIGSGGGEVSLETEPNIRIQGVDGYGCLSFCFLDSVLYLFDNFNKFDLSERRYKKTCVYKYDFDPDEVCEKKNFLLELSTLGVFSRMLTPKEYARAVPIPDGRILVHSCEIDIPIKDGVIFKDDHDEDLIHFEIFDPKTGLSVQLEAPELRMGRFDLELRTVDKGWISLPRDEPMMDKYKREIAVSANVNSILISKQTLVLSIQQHGTSKVFFLTLDIESPTAQGWQPYHGWLLPPAHVQDYSPDPNPSLVVEDRVCFTCRLGYANGNGNGNGNESAQLVEHPLSDISSIPLPFFAGPSCIALVDYLPNQECWFSVVRTRFARRLGEYLVIDVFKGELPSRKKNKATPQVQRIKSFKFHIPVRDECFFVQNAFMLSHTIFPFPLL